MTGGARRPARLPALRRLPVLALLVLLPACGSLDPGDLFGSDEAPTPSVNLGGRGLVYDAGGSKASLRRTLNDARRRCRGRGAVPTTVNATDDGPSLAFRCQGSAAQRVNVVVDAGERGRGQSLGSAACRERRRTAVRGEERRVGDALLMSFVCVKG